MAGQEAIGASRWRDNWTSLVFEELQFSDYSITENDCSVYGNLLAW